jgi:hypothetical protein
MILAASMLSTIIVSSPPKIVLPLPTIDLNSQAASLLTAA